MHAAVLPMFAGICSFAPSTVIPSSGWKCSETFVWPFGKHAISVLFQNASGFAPKSLPHDNRTTINTRTPPPMKYFFILVDYFLLRVRASPDTKRGTVSRAKLNRPARKVHHV